MAEQAQHSRRKWVRRARSLHSAQHAVIKPAQMIVDARKPVADFKFNVIGMLDQLAAWISARLRRSAQNFKAMEFALTRYIEKENRRIRTLATFPRLQPACP